MIGGILLTSLCLNCLISLTWNLELHFLMCISVLLFCEILCRMLTCLSNRSFANLSGPASQKSVSAFTHRSSRTLDMVLLSSSVVFCPLQIQTLIEIFAICLVSLPFSLLLWVICLPSFHCAFGRQGNCGSHFELLSPHLILS